MYFSAGKNEKQQEASLPGLCAVRCVQADSCAAALDIFVGITYNRKENSAGRALARPACAAEPLRRGRRDSEDGISE